MEGIITKPEIWMPLLYLKGQGGQTSAYTIDRYITIHLNTYGSHNEILKQLLDLKLIELHRDRDKTVQLTQLAKNEIGGVYDRIDSLYKKLRTDFYESKLVDENEINVAIPLFYFKSLRAHFSIRPIEIGETILYQLRCPLNLANDLVSDSRISETIIEETSFVIDMVRVHTEIIKLHYPA